MIVTAATRREREREAIVTSIIHLCTCKLLSFPSNPSPSIHRAIDVHISLQISLRSSPLSLVLVAPFLIPTFHLFTIFFLDSRKKIARLFLQLFWMKHNQALPASMRRDPAEWNSFSLHRSNHPNRIFSNRYAFLPCSSLPPLLIKNNFSYLHRRYFLSRALPGRQLVGSFAIRVYVVTLV